MKRTSFNRIIFVILFSLVCIFFVTLFYPKPRFSAYTSGSGYISSDESSASANNYIIMPLNMNNINKDTEFSLNLEKSVFNLSVNGHVTFNSTNSLVRVVMRDNNQREYVVYETYPLISDKNDFDIRGLCEETCLLGDVIPSSIRVTIVDANVSLDSLTFFPASISRIKSVTQLDLQRQNLKNKKEAIKIQKINEQIKARGQRWVAGETSVSNLTYSEKKKLFSYENGTPVEDLPNLQGFEYYTGGIFELSPSKDSNESLAKDIKLSPGEESQLPSSWDWRDVHGENWMSPVKDQGRAGTCWAHSLMGAIESQINLYYNQHLNLDLSEQQILDCINDDYLPQSMYSGLYSDCSGINQCYPGSSACVISEHGISDESCDPYAQRDLWPSNCDSNHVCGDWQERTWKNSDFHDYKFLSDFGTPKCSRQTMDLSENDFKKVLIEKGPLDSGILSWHHAMVLAGYASGDWKTLYSCGVGELFDYDKGCIPKYCNKEGDTIVACTNNFNIIDNRLSITGGYATFTCLNTLEWNTGTTYSREYCGSNMACVNNTCRPASELNLINGHKEYFFELNRLVVKEYSIGNGDSYWIFKNSYGPNWGENGYVRIATLSNNFGWGSAVLGPFTPPSNRRYWPIGFDGNIKCYDKDNDGYCNWGISDIGLNNTWRGQNCPATCKSQPLRDCDDSNNTLRSFGENYNCVSTPLPTPSCFDSDGVNYFAKGTLTTNAASWQSPVSDRCEYQLITNPGQYVSTSSCSVPNGYKSKCYVQEYYCSGTKPSFVIYACNASCSDGACKS